MRREPNLTPETKFAMYNPSAGCVCPYGLTIAYAENAVQNGAQVSLNTAVLSMEVSEHNIISVTTNRGVIHPKIVINAAGVLPKILPPWRMTDFLDSSASRNQLDS